MHGLSQDLSHGAGEGGELAHTSSKETSGSPEASELGSPRCTPNFDLLNMVVSYKRMALFLEPATDAVELIRFLLGCVCMFVCGLFEHHMISLVLALHCDCSKKNDRVFKIICFFFLSLRWKMPLCSLLACMFLNVFFCIVNEGKISP